MEKIMSKCGIICSDCNAYKATIQNSDELRKKTADEWSKMFQTDIDPATINCLGCQSTDVDSLFGHCRVCQVRSCAMEKKLPTCADCGDYGCELVMQIWNYDEGIKKNLDALRK